MANGKGMLIMFEVKKYPTSFIVNSLATGAIIGVLVFTLITIYILTSDQDALAEIFGTDPALIFWFYVPAAGLGAFAGLIFDIFLLLIQRMSRKSHSARISDHERTNLLKTKEKSK